MRDNTNQGGTGHVYREGKFIVPDSARAEFLSRAKAIRDVLRKQEGFVRDSYLEKISGRRKPFWFRKRPILLKNSEL